MKPGKMIAVILIFCIFASFYSCGTNKESQKESRITAEIAGIAYEYNDSEKFEDVLRKFSLNSASVIFSDEKNNKKNLCYSPASLYVAFALAASGAENQTRDEMFAALGLTGRDKKYISEQINDLFGKLSFENHYGVLKIANSVWLKKDADIKKEYKENANDNFHSQIFSADFKNIPETPDMMKKWVEENTNNLISPKFDYSDPEIIFMYILNTLYFKDSWRDSFDKRSTQSDLFYAADNKQVECEFMNKLISAHPFFSGEGFTASSLDLYNGGKMTFVLPDEETDIYDLLSSPKKLDYIFNQANEKTGNVHFKVPKFKTQASFDLIGTLKYMGVKQAFIAETADFSGITGEQIYISEVAQETYIKIDETGVEAAAMTRVEVKAGGLLAPNEQVNMFLDRPFIYFITDKGGVILFEGVIFDPKS